MSAGKIDDAEAPHAEADIPGRTNALLIRAAVHDGGTHLSHGSGIDEFTLPAYDTCYPAHRSTASRLSSVRAFGVRGAVPRTEIGTLATCRSSNPQLSNQRKTSS